MVAVDELPESGGPPVFEVPEKVVSSFQLLVPGGERAASRSPFVSRLNRRELHSGAAQAIKVNVHGAPPEQITRHQKPHPEINRTPHNRAPPEALQAFLDGRVPAGLPGRAHLALKRRCDPTAANLSRHDKGGKIAGVIGGSYLRDSDCAFRG